MRDNDYQILYRELLAITDYAQSCRTVARSNEDYNNKKRNADDFYNRLLYYIMLFEYQPFIDNFSNYVYVRLKLALTTRDFSCMEYIIWLCYRFFNNKNVSERSKNEIKLLNYVKHKFLCLPREYKIFSPVQKFSSHKNIISDVDYYTTVNCRGVQAHLIDHTFMIEHFKNIALLDDNIQMKPYYNIKDLQRFETLPDEVKKLVQPLRDIGCI